MITNIIGNSSGALTVTTDKFNGIFMFTSAWGTAITTQNVMPCAGTFQNFYIKAATGNPSGKTFKIYKNGLDTAISIVLGANATTGNDITHTVSFVAGDTVSVHATGGDGTTNMGIISWALGANCAANVSMLLGSSGGAMGTTFPVFLPVSGLGNQVSGGSSEEAVMPTAGTIKNAYAVSNTNIAAASTLIHTLVKNGTPTSLVATISASTSTGNDTNAGHGVSVIQGDRIYWSVSSTGTPGSKTVAVSAEFDPTIDGESVIMFVPQGQSPSASANRWAPMGSNNDAYSTTEAAAETLTLAAIWKKLTLYFFTTPSPGTFKFQGVFGLSSLGPTLTMSTSGTFTDNSNTTTSTDGETVSMSIVPASTPTAVPPAWGMVMFIAPTTTTNSNFLMFM